MTKRFYTKAELTDGLPESEKQPNPSGMTVSPIEPTVCKNTGRLLTEWHEFPELTDEDIKEMAMLAAGFDELPGKMSYDMTPEEKDKFNIYKGAIARRKQTKFKGGMSKQEVQHRMNEASKLVDPDNVKFLDKATQDKLGLETNPLWHMEALARSGTLSPKDQAMVWAKLAEYTHSKAATVNHNTHSTYDELMQKIMDDAAIEVEYAPIEVEPRIDAQPGMGKLYARIQEDKVKTSEQAEEITDAAFEDYAAQMSDIDLKDFYPDGHK